MEADSNVQRPPIIPRLKFLCSFGGRIQPRPGDNRLVYFGGKTKNFSVDRMARSFSTIMAKLSVMSGARRVLLKYQLPGEDLDALVSVTDDADVEQLVAEHDRWRGSHRLRLFLFDSSPENDLRPVPDFLLGLEDSSGIASDYCEKDDNQLVRCSGEQRQRGDRPETGVMGGEDSVASTFPPRPIQPITRGMGPAATWVAHFPAVTSPRYVGGPCQAGMFPTSQLSGTSMHCSMLFPARHHHP